MSVWIWSGQTALVVGSIAFAGAFLPLAVWHYRRYGAGDPRRLAGSFAVAVYLTALVTYTLLPLPPRAESWCVENAVTTVQLEPFRFVSDIARDTAGMSLRAALRSETVLQVVFNVLLFIPWGVLARSWAHQSRLVSMLSGLAVSLFIETTQFTALWGIYPCRYRWPDVDDVILNGSGAVIGTLLAPAVLWWMPQARTLAAGRRTPRPVTTLRRWVGMVIDLALSSFVVGVVGVGALVLRQLRGGEIEPTFTGGVGAVATLAAWLIVFVWPAWSGSGASAGQAAVWLTPVWSDGRGGWSWGTRLQRLSRASILPAVVFLGSLPGTQGWALPAYLLLGTAVLSVPVTRGRRGLTFLLTGAELRDAREPLAGHRPDPGGAGSAAGQDAPRSRQNSLPEGSRNTVQS